MNCETTMHWILLEASGELPADRRAALSAHLDGCGACREYRASLDFLRTGTRSDAASIPALDPARLTTIISASEQGRRLSPLARRGRTRWFERIPAPALAYAAAILVAFGIGFSLTVLRTPNAPALAANGGANAAWTMDEWLDVELDLLNSELSATSADWAESSRGADDDDSSAGQPSPTEV